MISYDVTGRDSGPGTKGSAMLRTPFAAAAIAALIVASMPAHAHAATYRGRSIDGPRYCARIENADLGSVEQVEIKFSGSHATVFLNSGSQIHLELDDEEISDPRHVDARDQRRGVTWEISIRNLR